MTYSAIPAAIVALPFAAALLARPLGRRSEPLRNWFAVVVTGLTFLGSVALIPLVAEHHIVGSKIPVLLGHITFEVDSFGMFFALFTSFVWMASTLYAGSYMQHEQKRDRYFTVNLAVLGANMGVVLAGDLISLYLFFEALGLLAYWLVVHTETPEALKASTKYLWMTVMGGFALVAGIFITFGLGSTGHLGPVPMAEGQELLMWAAAILMIVGFGVKAGIVPVHVWLPDAHPVAPSPASALLSGIMIKAGAYGIFRVVTALFRPPIMEEVAEELWHFTTQLGFAVIWIGIATMFIGVVLALLQENAKRMLAYHSVSQMGFIITGIGVAGYLGAHGAMGFAGGLYHIVNHALFKACLFLGVGAVYFRTHELNMYKLGGLWKKMPLTFLFTLIAACGITGVPLFNGFVSKTLLHHGLVEAVEHASHLAHAAHSTGLARQATALSVAEKIFVLTCGGTAASFIKLIVFVFLGKPKQEFPGVKDAPARMLVAMGALAVPIVALGLAPNLMLKGVISPGLHTWGLHSEILDHFVLFAGGDLMAVLIAFAIGTTVVIVGVRFGLFHAHFPAWLSIDYWYRRTARAFLAFCVSANQSYEAYTGFMSRAIIRTLRMTSRYGVRIQRNWRRVIVTLGTGAPGLRHQQFIETAYVIIERERHETVRHAVDAAVMKAENSRDMDEALRQQYVNSVRDTAMYMATRLFDERIDAVAELARTGRIEPLRVALNESMIRVEKWRQPVTDLALELAPRRMRGENILREIAREMNDIMAKERFDVLIRESIPSWSASQAAARLGHRVGQAVPREEVASAYQAGSLAAARLGHRVGQAVPSQEVVSAYRAGGLTKIERAGGWLSDTATTVIESIIQERIPWIIDDHMDNRRLASARLAIQRYVRDIGLNVGIAIAMLLVFVLTAMAGIT
ncbi:MAG: complex I subunit 5 family protein [Actinomycetota bacterium]|nr:complex I subunit 5 family protein [Actinomycetota bacterium]